MARFRGALEPRAGQRILDVGGTADFWRGSDLAADITIVNPDPGAAATSSDRRETATGTPRVQVGDGCALPFADASFDVVFSNSAIEHVGTWERQQRFAAETRRVGRRLWVQTPAREFFIEPHLIAPFVHWLPERWQRRVIRRGTLRGWLERWDARNVDAFLGEVRLLTLDEMRALFPDCTILRERFLGMTKSYVAVRP